MEDIMKWFGGTIAGIFLGFIFVILFIMIQSGSFKKVDLKLANYGPYIAIYKTRLGAYHESSKTLFEVEEILKKNNILCVITFGLYLDDPNDTEADRLRSELGCLFSEKYKDQLQTFIETNPNSENPNANLGLKLKYINEKEYISGAFEGSPALVTLKVYPKIKNWAKKNRYNLKPEVLELYEVKSSDKVKTTVLFELIK